MLMRGSRGCCRPVTNGLVMSRPSEVVAIGRIRACIVPVGSAMRRAITRVLLLEKGRGLRAMVLPHKSGTGTGRAEPARRDRPGGQMGAALARRAELDRADVLVRSGHEMHERDRVVAVALAAVA